MHKIRKHSEETKRKIAIGNTGKIFSNQRRKAISDALKQKSITPRLLDQLRELWSYRFLNPKVIRELTGIGGTLYKRLFRELCDVPQIKFMPSDLYPDELKQIQDLANQNVWYKEISKITQRGEKQILHILKKMGFTPNTKNPNAYTCVASKVENQVGAWLEEHGVLITRQFKVQSFYFDFHVINTNVLIEVHGDYWHCNPSVYLNGPINDWQKFSIKRDFCKRDIAKKLGYKRYVIWEKDVKTSFEEVMLKLLEKINANRGVF